MALSTTVPLKKDGQGGVVAEFVLEEGKSQVFMLKDDCGEGTLSSPLSEKEAEAVAEHGQILAGLDFRLYLPRPLAGAGATIGLTLKLLTFEPTGAIAAAATTSLPEVIGGVRNWDYRYTWLRDAAFTVYGFCASVSKTEAAAFSRWIQDYAAKRAHPGKNGAVVFTHSGRAFSA